MDWLRDVWEGVCEYGWKIGVATAAVLLVAALLYEFRRHFRIVRKGFGAALWTLQRSLVFIWFGLLKVIGRSPVVDCWDSPFFSSGFVSIR